jgi:uncharacterized protein Yka (UPF0111/DUF47 family)
MATDKQLVDALRDAAEALLGRKLSQQEINELIAEHFNKATGTNRERARKAIKGFVNIEEGEIVKKSSASDDVDRKVRDLENVIDKWKAGS